MRPQTFAEGGLRARTTADLLTFQSVPDRFYFMLLGAVISKLRIHLTGRTEVIVVRSISGAVGTGWLAALKRSAPVSWLWGSRWVRAYGALVDGVAYHCATWRHPIRDYADWRRSNLLWQELKRDHVSLLVDGVEVADLIVDSYLRFKPSPAFDVNDRFVRRLIWQALRDVRQARAYFGREKPRLYLTSYSTYLEHGIPVRVALRHGVVVWSFGSLSRFGKRLTLADSYHTPDCSGYRAGFDALEHRDECLEAARRGLEARLAGGIDAATSYMRQSAYGQSEVELPAGLDGAVVVFLHDFYDSPHIYPDLVFQDFWCWVCFTVEVLQKSGVTFFLKPHPNQIALSDEALGRLRREYPGLQWLPTNASNVQLARAGIACGVTVYGTVAHELAYLGVPSIACARHPHYTFDFCRTARTREEYKSMLESYGVRPLPKEDMQRQALAFYYMHNLYGSPGERELRQAFVELWMACNVRQASEDGVMQACQRLVRLPAFEQQLLTMLTCESHDIE